jgi:hypothetical protein
MNIGNEIDQASAEPNPSERRSRLAHNKPDENEKKDHGPHLPEKDLQVKRPQTPPLDPSQKQGTQTN